MKKKKEKHFKSMNEYRKSYFPKGIPDEDGIEVTRENIQENEGARIVREVLKRIDLEKML